MAFHSPDCSAKVLEEVGIFGPRARCQACGKVFEDKELREIKRTRTWKTPGGLELPVPFPYLTWRCGGGCDSQVPVLRSCELANNWQSLLQNATLFWHWSRMQEPSGDDLSEFGFVDHAKVPASFQSPLRKVVAEEQVISDMFLQLGGVGVDVEMDEVSFRWRKDPDGEGSIVDRYLGVCERVSRKMLLIKLPTKHVKIGGRCGAITNEELYNAMFPRGREPILLPGTVVHTDSAKAYRNLAWTGMAFTEEPPAELGAHLATEERPSPWRWEMPEEAEERRQAEGQEELGTLAGRTEFWAARYRHLCLVHTAVVHKKKVGQARRQYVVMRRCRFMPEDAEVVQAKGNDPWLVGTVSWRKGGTQKIDGYWRTLRKRTAYRGSNSRFGGMDASVMVHQWSHRAGPGVCLFSHLGATLQERRNRSEVDKEVARRAWEEVGEEEQEASVPEHVPAGSRTRVYQIWRREAASGRGNQRAAEEFLRVGERRRQAARVGAARSTFAANSARRQAEKAMAQAAAAQARAPDAQAEAEAVVVEAEAAAAEAQAQERAGRQRMLAAEASAREAADSLAAVREGRRSPSTPRHSLQVTPSPGGTPPSGPPSPSPSPNPVRRSSPELEDLAERAVGAAVPVRTSGRLRKQTASKVFGDAEPQGLSGGGGSSGAAASSSAMGGGGRRGWRVREGLLTESWQNYYAEVLSVFEAETAQRRQQLDLLAPGTPRHREQLARNQAATAAARAKLEQIARDGGLPEPS